MTEKRGKVSLAARRRIDTNVKEVPDYLKPSRNVHDLPAYTEAFVNRPNQDKLHKLLVDLRVDK